MGSVSNMDAIRLWHMGSGFMGRLQYNDSHNLGENEGSFVRPVRLA